VTNDPAVQRRLLLSLGFTIFFSVLNSTLFNVPLPDIARQFSLLPSEGGWVVSGCIILFAIASATCGRLVPARTGSAAH
jgi:DHA2 family metal-tetracycline-proton antiporter-like MFS transporter